MVAISSEMVGMADYAQAGGPVEQSMTTAERAELGRHEAVVTRGLSAFIEVGNALAAIRDSELYRETHANFLDYCREKWGIGKSHIYRLLAAAEVAGNLGESPPLGEIGERVLRPLAKLPPEQQREAWQEAVEESGGKPTAADVEKSAVKFAPPKPPTRAEVKALRQEHIKPTPSPARVQYVEPTPKAEPPVPVPAVDALVELMISPDVIITGDLPNSLHWAVRQATVEQLQEALRLLPDELRMGRGPVLHARLKALGVVVAKPAPARDIDNAARLEKAHTLVNYLTFVRKIAREDYGELTGRHTDLLEFERGVEAMLPPLERLIAMLEEGE